MSSAAWQNAKTANAILPAGQVTPGPKVWTGEDNPDAIPFQDWIPESKWTDGMREIAEFARRVAEKVLSRQIVVRFVRRRIILEQLPMGQPVSWCSTNCGWAHSGLNKVSPMRW